MVVGKHKGRSFERKIYKIFRDDDRFTDVKLTLGSGSSDEPSDMHFKLVNQKYIVETKKGSKSYCSETNLGKYWAKLYDRITDEIPVLCYQANYEDIYVWIEIRGIIMRMKFTHFFNLYLR